MVVVLTTPKCLSVSGEIGSVARLAHWHDEDACLIAVTISRGGFCSSAFASVLTAEFDEAEFGEEGAISGGRAVTSTRRPT
jgi:hypothetical protein